MSKDTLYDRRIIGRNINLGRVNRKEFEQYLGSLPDVSDKSVPMFSSTPISREDQYDEEDDEG